MKHAKLIAVSSMVVWVAGCASAPKVVLQERVGPCHPVVAKATGDGWLQVYSARERAPIDMNADVFLGNTEILYAAAHTDYKIFSPDGTVLKRVRNWRDLNEARPTLVRLPAGNYSVEAEAEEAGGWTMTVVIPLVVEAGQATTVHLEPMSEPSGETLDANRLVRLADGRIIGCRAVERLSQRGQSTTLAKR